MSAAQMVAGWLSRIMIGQKQLDRVESARKVFSDTLRNHPIVPEVMRIQLSEILAEVEEKASVLVSTVPPPSGAVDPENSSVLPDLAQNESYDGGANKNQLSPEVPLGKISVKEPDAEQHQLRGQSATRTKTP